MTQFLRPFFICMFLLNLLVNSYAQDIKITYKTIDTTELSMDIYNPSNYGSTDNNPAMVFFYGGGWKGGSVKQFEPHAKYFSQRGIVCFLVGYRVSSRQSTSPFESLKDAKSAIRYIRENAKRFNIDPAKIIAAGGSAGGHLAAATALITEYNEVNEDTTISCKPNALVLFNPVIDNGPGGYGYDRIGERYKDFSPLHNIMSGAPPTILFLGTEDRLIPVVTAEYYKTVMEKVGSRCDLHLYEGQGHGFFNFSHQDYYVKTVMKADQFLRSLGYVDGDPTISQ